MRDQAMILGSIKDGGWKVSLPSIVSVKKGKSPSPRLLYFLLESLLENMLDFGRCLRKRLYAVIALQNLCFEPLVAFHKVRFQGAKNLNAQSVVLLRQMFLDAIEHVLDVAFIALQLRDKFVHVRHHRLLRDEVLQLLLLIISEFILQFIPEFVKLGQFVFYMPTHIRVQVLRVQLVRLLHFGLQSADPVISLIKHLLRS
mmetsp:Transcript_29501/g.47313  ORF Transcript_29501/g.47313 Transcript_29501/m.47313 type:complete len:200 (+) Transcript_29501:123-722(+)